MKSACLLVKAGEPNSESGVYLSPEMVRLCAPILSAYLLEPCEMPDFNGLGVLLGDGVPAETFAT